MDYNISKFFRRYNSMPELPEVETIMRGLTPHLEGAIIQDVIIRHPQLRWPIPQNLKSHLNQQKIIQLSRRGKYLLIHIARGTLIVHLGMSGSLRILKHHTSPTRHDHVDIIFSDHFLLRYHDPRRFGAVLWTEDDPYMHPLLKNMGIEPLDPQFTGQYLKNTTLKRHVAIKPFIMNSKIVTGIGNIYAAEALFLANIHPLTRSSLLTQTQCERLVDAIQKILKAAIAQGGTTLKDFVNSDGKPGYFSQKLHVYGRGGLPCTVCATPLQSIQLGQRSTVFCAHCQLDTNCL
ncbi:MAG: bifunctional DNA-formamidopyrimidine glycosylase/DNA-(apurinic or apyrimidinic site) lyase [Legionellaceae bacterium]|nr:bifunctional DNA-formamidopyrimidine glycosylase/DNA-(apurinic or apyrimidinic site) lyase [Legionellaceae bacterium]